MNPNNRVIAHLDLDAFFVSCARIKDPTLNNIPIIIGAHSRRGVVSSCSYEARKYGVRSAMPVMKALKLCPQAKVVNGDMGLFTQKSKEVTNILKEAAPVVEKSSIDEFFLDLTGMERYFGCEKWTTALVERIARETGLPISFGLSTNKTVAKIATGEGKPLGRVSVPEDKVRAFLAPLSIRKIPMLGKKTYEKFAKLGIYHIGELAEMSEEMVVHLLGKNGKSLWRKANGIDNRAVEPYSERKSISTERTFSKDTRDIETLKSMLLGMIEKLAFQLRKEDKYCSTLAVKIRYGDFETHTKQCKIPYTNLDHYMMEPIYDLFEKAYLKKKAIRLIGVKCGDLIGSGHQLDLFNEDAKLNALYQAMDIIKNKYGRKSVGKSSAYYKKRDSNKNSKEEGSDEG